MLDWHSWLDGRTPRIMGILNANPDSFWTPSRVGDLDTMVPADRALRMVDEGADCLDLGGESTRPGAAYIDAESELQRLLPVLKAVRKAVGVPLSIDTRKAKVARICLEEGADLINDVSALRDDPEMAGLIARHDCPVVLMHMKGEPSTMQQNPRYDDCVAEVCTFLHQRASFAREAGITKIALDPGLGFGKRQEDNLALLNRLTELVSAGFPVLVGASRKGFIGHCLGRMEKGSLVPRPAEERLSGSLGVAAWAFLAGARILRVHDARETRDVIRLISCIRTGETDV